MDALLGMISYLFKTVNLVKRSYFCRNPYLNHVEKFIQYYVVPYRSIEDLEARNIDRNRLVICIVHIVILLVNLFRFVIIALNEKDAQVREYCMELFSDQPNHEFFYITLVLLFLCPTILCKNLNSQS